MPSSTQPDEPFTFPLKISEGQRYLVDRNDRPFLIHGDTAWSLFSALNAAEVERYLADRQAKGFNAIIANLVEHKFNGPMNRFGESPFHNPEDLSTPNGRYFEFADWIIEKCAENGLVLFLAPLYLGIVNHSDDEGWYYEAGLSGAGKCFEYGRYIGERYARFDNIVWLMGGDRNPRRVTDEVNSLVMGIKSFCQAGLFTASPALEESTAETYGSAGWLDFNSTYSYAIVHQKLIADYRCRPVKPFVLLSSSYENEHNASSLQIRRQAYWALLSGAAGQFLGNYPIWLHNPGWEAALDSPGSLERIYVKRLFDSRAWQKLVPDQEHTVVTAGLGEFNGLDYLAAALAEDGITLIAYLPTPRTITVDLAKINSDRAVGWWFDPRTGETLPAGIFFTSSPVQFTSPGPGDWVLVVDSASVDLPPPGNFS